MPHEAGQHLVCGSGNEAAAVRKEFTKQRFLQIDLGLQPGVLRSFMGNDSGELPSELQHLVHSPEQPSNWHLDTTTPCYAKHCTADFAVSLPGRFQTH